jgi:hypothetical protein
VSTGRAGNGARFEQTSLGYESETTYVHQHIELFHHPAACSGVHVGLPILDNLTDGERAMSKRDSVANLIL